MASLRPSQFNQESREDDGPFLIFSPSEPGEEIVDVYFTYVPPEQRTPQFMKIRAGILQKTTAFKRGYQRHNM